MAKTKAPSGLALARNNLAFACSWKISEKDYNDGQQLQWRTNLQKWTTVTVGASTTKKTVSLTASTFYPTTKKKLTYISFRVKGKKSGAEWSDWTTKTLTLKAPAVPTLKATLHSSNNNVTTFSWTVKTATNDNKHFVNVEWQTILVKESNVTDGSKLSWKTSATGWATGTGSATGSTVRTEDTSLLAANSYTRWVRVRSRGSGGASAWRYAKHVYARSYAATITKATASVRSGKTTIKAEWTAAANASHPIDSTMVRYAMDTPATGMACPSGASWTEIATSKDTSGTDAWTGQISEILEPDQALWIQIQTTHDRNDTYSEPALAMVGALQAPTGLSVSTNESTHRATITATNQSAVPDSAIAVLYQSTNVKPFVIGIIPHGSTSVTVQCPDWSAEPATAFGVYAFQGSYTQITRADGVGAYAVTANMRSAEVWSGGSVPQAPGNVSARMSETAGEVILEWDWTWNTANTAELSWSTNPNAWESTDEPETYEISNLHAAKWRVSGLETGQTWYFCIRLGIGGDDEVTYGPYSTMVSVDLSSAPIAPVLNLSSAVITETGEVTASWVYTSTDGTVQAYAEIYEATISGDVVTIGDKVAGVGTAQHTTLNAEDMGWTTGETYSLCVRVISESGRISEYSDPVSVTIAEPVTCTISATSLVSQTITVDGVARTVQSLTILPLTATITGAGTSGTTTLIIERSADYIVDRPDETEFIGFEGETAVIYTQTGEAQITIERDDLLQMMDDGAQYRLIATVSDDLGQSASETIDFEVHWAHQAVMPTGSAVMDGAVAKITPTKPSGWATGDTCDIYRLSVDRPELIVQGGEFGVTYVDPYPAIGESGGHRIVFRTINGDYITGSDTFAWLDTDERFSSLESIIEFPGGTINLAYNMSTSHSWKKDFTETRYLGGATQGDWSAGYSRSDKIEGVSVVSDDLEMIETMRRLAVYTGICHVRTVDGSSYAADVQVSEDRTYSEAGNLANFSLSIIRVDSEELDGVTLAEWEA